MSSRVDTLIDKIKQLDIDELPRGLAGRKLTIKFNAFPTIKTYPDKSLSFTMRLIEAIAGEGFSEAQEGYIIRWLREIQDNQQNLSDINLIESMLNRVDKDVSRKDSRPPLKRILNRALYSLRDLIDRGCQSLDMSTFVNAFCPYNGNLSNVSMVIFDLSNLISDYIRRALVYAVMSFIFDEYKSRSLVMGQNAYPILFAVEEARTLIPREEEEGRETHPATRASRIASRQTATEGRKMGLGLLVISQKPASVDPITVSQANTLILHRASNPDDQNYIRSVGESLSPEDIETLKTVKEGVAIVTGDALKTRISTLVKIRNRYSEAGVDRPRPIEAFWTQNQ